MKIEKNDMVIVYDGGGTVPHCKYIGRFGDLRNTGRRLSRMRFICSG